MKLLKSSFSSLCKVGNVGGIILSLFLGTSCCTMKRPAFIVISKEEMKLGVYNSNGDILKEFPIACGLNYGNKEKKGDMKTPEGVFYISSIEDASDWDHDFQDGKGVIAGAYGPYFFRLYTPGHEGIGIHGTHLPESIGTRATEGCIRLNNKDLKELRKSVRKGLPVVITPSKKDIVTSKDSTKNDIN